MRKTFKQKIIEESFFSNLVRNLNNPQGTSGPMLDRAAKINPLDATAQHKKANDFKEEQHEMKLSENKRKFVTGQDHDANTRFEMNRQLQLNKV